MQADKGLISYASRWRKKGLPDMRSRLVSVKVSTEQKDPLPPPKKRKGEATGGGGGGGGGAVETQKGKRGASSTLVVCVEQVHGPLAKGRPQKRASSPGVVGPVDECLEPLFKVREKKVPLKRSDCRNRISL